MKKVSIFIVLMSLTILSFSQTKVDSIPKVDTTKPVVKPVVTPQIIVNKCSDLWSDTTKNIIEIIPTIIHDGDGLVWKNGNVWTNFRLVGIDCPEVISNHISKNQEGGVEAGKYLRNMIKLKIVKIQLKGRDSYKRQLCNLAFNGYDIGLNMLEIGAAWYAPSLRLTRKQRKAYKAAEAYAKDNKFGIWSNENPMKPSDFRKKNRY